MARRRRRRAALALVFALATCYSGRLQLRVLREFAASMSAPPAAGPLAGLLQAAPSPSSPGGCASEASGAVNAGGAPARRIYCPRCPWNDRTRSPCWKRRAYLLTKDPNETKADSDLLFHHPGCFIERAALEKRRCSAGATGGGGGVDPRRGASGRWVQDQDYARRNAFIDHVTFHTWGLGGTETRKEYTKDYTLETVLQRRATSWKWADDRSPVAEITLDGFCRVCHRLEITRLYIVGDSLSQDFRRSLEAHLGFTHPEGKTINRLFEKMVWGTSKITCDQSVEGFGEVLIAFRKINGLDEESTGALAAAEIGVPQFVSDNTNRTAVVLNFGAHMRDLDKYRSALNAVLGWIDSWSRGEGGVDAGRLVAFYRETVPGHPGCHPRGTAESNTNMIDKVVRQKFDTETSKGIFQRKFEMLKADGTDPFVSYDEYHAYTRNEMDAQLRLPEKNRTWQWFDFQHANGTFEGYNEHTRLTLEGRKERVGAVPFHWLKVYNATVLRRDGHKAFGDCLHYLQPGPYSLWVHVFYSALLDLAGLEHRVQ